jgi:molecular chaperone HtpG
MQKDQKTIYYITAETYESAKGSPHLEVFNKKDIEVLLLSDRVDEWMVSNFGEFEGVPFKSIAKGNLEDLDSKEDKKEKEKVSKDYEKVIEKHNKILEPQVEEVKISPSLRTAWSNKTLAKSSSILVLSFFTNGCVG